MLSKKSLSINKTNNIFLKSTKAFICFCAFIFIASDSVAQSEDYSDKFKLIEQVKQYWLDSLKFDLPPNFYTNTTEIDTSMLFYVYASRLDSIKSPAGFGDFKYCKDQTEADSVSKIYNNNNTVAFIYKTAGNTNYRISEAMLKYDDESIAFLLFHEATHFLARSLYKGIPYNIEEAICDHNANCLTLNFFKAYPELNYEAALFQKNRIEAIYNSINENYITYIFENKFSQGHLFSLKDLINNDKLNNAFMRCRYNYPISNAYFLRNNYYSNNYFFLNAYFENKTTQQIKKGLIELLKPHTIEQLQKVSNIIYQKRQ